VSKWADAVQRAAYAGSPVDAAVQEEVNRLVPAEPEPVLSEAVPTEARKRILRRLRKEGARSKGPKT
jgi:hypothetical protein